jgi:hypothetical protein
MPSISIEFLAALCIAASIHFTSQIRERSPRQPVAESGFWVTETDSSRRTTTIRFYATSNHLVSERKENRDLDIKRLATRKYLNRLLKNELENDSLTKSLPKLYEIH